jgi:hypothetical protein
MFGVELYTIASVMKFTDDDFGLKLLHSVDDKVVIHY